MLDARNTLLQHTLVGVFTAILAFVFYSLLGIRWSTTFARISFIFLFIALMIGPIMRLKWTREVKPLSHSWRWRSEFGIWFTITGLIHVCFVLNGRPHWSFIKSLGGGIGGGGYGLASLIGYIALFWALILAATSFGKAIKFLGFETWKWIHNFVYVVFYLVAAHLIYFQFFSSHGGGPDWFGYTSVVMMILVVLFQFLAFLKSASESKEKLRH